ncbi:WxL domain-containing protein [Paenibacillus larvae]
MKNIKCLTVAAALLAGLGMGTQGVYAADAGSVGGSYDSKANIEFIPSDEVTPPVDPDNPDKPAEPVDPNQPGTNGPLSIDFASTFKFGTQKITSKDATYYAEPQKFKDGSEHPNYVQVSDNRGTESGWTLQVKQNGQLKSEKNHELTGAAITVKNAGINTGSSSAKPSQVQSSFTLTPNEAVQIVGAKQGEGSGTYVYKFGAAADKNMDKSVELFVPGSTTKYAEKYETTLTWTLSDVPVNE